MENTPVPPGRHRPAPPPPDIATGTQPGVPADTGPWPNAHADPITDTRPDAPAFPISGTRPDTTTGSRPGAPVDPISGTRTDTTAPPDAVPRVAGVSGAVGLSPGAVFLDEQCRLLDAVFDADRVVAAAFAARAVAIDAVRAHSERDRGVSVLSPVIARRSLVAELGCGLRLPAPSAENLLEESRALVHTLPDTLAALAAGDAGYRHAQILVA
ncbi:hypothetical protein AB4Y94_15665, partial [Glaciibacter sp. 2TAF33]